MPTAPGDRFASRTASLGCEPGFTIIELVVVVALIGIVIGIAAPRFDFARFEIQGAVQRVSTSLLAAQRTAIKRQHNVIVAFDVDQGLIRIHEDANNNGQIDPGEMVRYIELGEHVVFGRTTAPARTIGSDAISFVRVQEGLPAITFQRSGGASEAGGIYLTSRRAQVTGDNRRNDDYAIEVERATGRVSWFHFGGTAWGRGF